MTVASFSALAIVTAAVLYLMALVFHTLEWALARNVEATVTESVAADGKGGVALLDKPSVETRTASQGRRLRADGVQPHHPPCRSWTWWASSPAASRRTVRRGATCTSS